MRTKTKNNIKSIIKWTITAMIIILSAVIATTGHADSSRPIILIPVAVCLAMSQNELVAGIIGAVCGLLVDITCGTIIGVNAVILLVVCVSISLLCLHLIKNNLIDAVLITIATAILQGFLNFFFNYVIWRVENYRYILTSMILPSVVWTTMTAPIVYLVIKYVFSKLSNQEKIIVE